MNTMRHMGSREVRSREGSAVLVELVCIAGHASDGRNADGYSLTNRGHLRAYCARGADQNHDWIRVPATPFDEITIAKMEDRPPEPRAPRDPMLRIG